jgi:hypothetical protein
MLFSDFVEKTFPSTQAERTTNANNDSWSAKLEGPSSITSLQDVQLGRYELLAGLDINSDLFIGESYDKIRRLVSGDDTDYANDTSSADIAIAALLLNEQFSPDEIEIIMRSSRYREKFDQLRGPNTYLECTINKAINSHSKNYEITKTESSIKTPIEVKRWELSDGLIDIPTSPPAPRDYVWDGYIVAGNTYVLGGFGGVSKSQMALQLAASLSVGSAFANRAIKGGASLLILSEDDKAEISRRVGAVAKHSNYDKQQRQNIQNKVRAFGLVGEDVRLTMNLGGTLHTVDVIATWIIDTAKELQVESGEPVRLIVLDHAGMVHGGDFNAREDVSLTMRVINRIAYETGAAVLLLAHSPKSAATSESSDSSAIAGSTAFVDHARGAFILATMRDAEAKQYGIGKELKHNYVSLTVVKNNYGPTGDVVWFTRESVAGFGVGVLSPINLTVPDKTLKSPNTVEGRIISLLKQNPGRFTKTELRESYSGLDGPLKASKSSIVEALDSLEKKHAVILRCPTSTERTNFGLLKQVKFVYEVAHG